MIVRRSGLILGAYLSFLFLAAGAFGKPVPKVTESSFLRKVIQSRDLGQIGAVVQRERHLSNLRLVCEAQLRVVRPRLLPIACFEVLVIERFSGVITDETFAAEREWLETVCLNRIASIEDQDILESATLDHSISPHCRSAIEERLKDLVYAATDSSPEQVFKGRFGRARRPSAKKLD